MIEEDYLEEEAKKKEEDDEFYHRQLEEKEQEARIKRMRHEALLRSRNIEVTNTGVDVLADILNIPITKEEV